MGKFVVSRKRKRTMCETGGQIGSSGLLGETEPDMRGLPSFARKEIDEFTTVDRRTFMKVSSGVLATGLAPSLTAKTNPPSETPYPVKWYPFTGHPESDTCWSLSVGPDGRIYAAACAESVPGA
jgi:hypothetical protein